MLISPSTAIAAEPAAEDIEDDNRLNDRHPNISEPSSNNQSASNAISSSSSSASSTTSSASVSSATTSLQTVTNNNSQQQVNSAAAAATSAGGRTNLSKVTEVPADRGKENSKIRKQSKMDKDDSGSSFSSHKTDINKGNTVRSYRNSPFGLTRHYLTMPDDGNGIFSQNYTLRSKGIGNIINQPGKYTQNSNLEEEEDADSDGEDSEPDSSKSNNTNNNSNRKRRWLNKSSHQKQQQQYDLEISSHNVTNECDLSVGASILANSPITKTRWQHNAHHHQHHNHQHQTGYKHNGDKQQLPQFQQPHHTNQALQHPHHRQPLDPIGLNPNFSSPAGDAGLDAPRCNAKDLENQTGFYDHQTQDHHHHNDLKRAQGLKIEELIQEPEECNSLLVRFSSIMYATFLVILGCILHVAELRQKSKNSTDHIYTTIVALIGILWLLFLQADLQRYKRYATKYILIETIFNDHHAQQDLERRRMLSANHHHHLQGPYDPTARSTSSSSASLVNDRLSMNTEVIFKKTAYKMYQQRAAMGRHNQHNQLKLPAHLRTRTGSNSVSHSSGSQGGEPYDFYQNNTNNKSSSSGGGGGSNGKMGSLPHLDGNMDSGGPASAENLVPAYKFLHGKMGANFYLKCGMAAFCFGHVIHEGLRFGQQVYFFGVGNVHCRDSAALVAHLITPLYSFYQLFMMFKYSNLVINRHKVLARFGLMHIIGTSVTFWFRTILEEAFEDFVHKMDYFKTNKPRINLALTNSLPSESSHFITLLNAITNTVRGPAAEAASITTEASDWSFVTPIPPSSGLVNSTTTQVTQSLLALMSSPLSETITPQIVRHLPDSYACAQNTLLTTKSMNALPYLYPFTIEYNLLLAATFLSLYFNIGKIGGTGNSNCRPPFMHHSNMVQKQQHRNLSSGPGSNVESSDNSSATRMRERGVGGWNDDTHYQKDYGEYKSNFVVNADCHSANKGLFCGFFVLLVTLVTIVIFFVTINKPTHIQLGIKINLIQEATLTALILIVTLAGFKQVVKLNRNPYLKDKVTTDDVLMLIPLPFFFIHSLLSFRAETASMSSGGAGGGGGSGTGSGGLNESPFSSSMLLHKNHINDPLTTPNGNLQSILLSTSNHNNHNINNTHSIESRSRLNNSLAGGHPYGTNGRLFVEEFISNSNSNSSGNNNNNFSNGRNISNSMDANGNSNSSQIDHFKLITVALNIVVMIEVLVQTNFIIDGMRRCSESRYLRFKKPGRELITFAILLNITYWIVATFETKSVEQYKTEIEYYGPLPYMFISHTTLPVMLFYRYHSSVCLAEIWNRAYKPPKKR